MAEVVHTTDILPPQEDAKRGSSLEAAARRLTVRPEANYPPTPFFTGPQAPCRFEAEVYNCIIRGHIPLQVNGTYYRCMPDQLWAPMYEDDVFINGDGAIDAVRIKNGHADFKQKFVRTEKFTIERAARKAVFGKYRNRYTDDPRVRHKIHSTANTHVIYFEKQLLALKEDSLPYAMDPDTLETKGAYDFNGQYTCPTFTAHPKIDPHTGEMIAMGYQASGDSSKTVAYFAFDKNGKKTEECWFQTPYSAMMHDFAASSKYIIFILVPLEAVSVDLLKQGHKHFAWSEDRPLTFGVLPRRKPKPEDIKWFTYKNAFYGHSGNAFDAENGDVVYLDAPLTYNNKFWFFPPVGQDMFTAPSGKAKPGGVRSHYVRWKFDLNATDSHVEPVELVSVDGEMPTLDPRIATKEYNYVFLALHDPSKDGGPAGGIYNSLAKCNVKDGTYDYWCAGDNIAVHEAAFIPRSQEAPEADGYVISIVNKHDKLLTDIVILDTADLASGPVAIIELPFRLRNGIHGSWVDGKDLPEEKDLCDMHAMTAEVIAEFAPKNAVSSAGELNGARATNSAG